MGIRLPNKYNARRVTDGDRTYASKLEHAVANILQMQQRAKQIDMLQYQVSVVMVLGLERFRMVPDFRYMDLETNEMVWAEAKGVETDRWLYNRKLWKAGLGPGRLEVWKGNYKKPYIHEVIYPYR